MLAITPLSIETITDWIDTGRRFALARYGDGEVACMRGDQGANCDGVVYTPALGEALYQSLQNADVLHCLSNVARRHGGAEWLAKHAPGVTWYKSDQVLVASEAGKLWPLRRALFHWRTLYIGPKRLCPALQAMLGVDDFVPVGLTTAFEECEAVMEAAIARIEADGHRLVGISAGPTAKVLVDRLARRCPEVTIVDFGSVWDMYAGFPSRSGPKCLTNARIDRLAWVNAHWRRNGDDA